MNLLIFFFLNFFFVAVSFFKKNEFFFCWFNLNITRGRKGINFHIIGWWHNRLPLNLNIIFFCCCCMLSMSLVFLLFFSGSRSVGILEDAFLTEIVHFAAQKHPVWRHGNGRQPEASRVFRRIIQRNERPARLRPALLRQLHLLPVPGTFKNKNAIIMLSLLTLQSQRVRVSCLAGSEMATRATSPLANPCLIYWIIIMEINQ